MGVSAEESYCLPSHQFGSMTHARRCLSRKAALSTNAPVQNYAHRPPGLQRQSFLPTSLPRHLLPFHDCRSHFIWKKNILSYTLSVISLLLRSIPFGLALAELRNLHWRGNPFPLCSERAAPLKSQLAWLNSFPLSTMYFWCNVGRRSLSPAPAIELDPSAMFNVSVWLGLNLAKSSVLCFIWKPYFSLPPSLPLSQSLSTGLFQMFLICPSVVCSTQFLNQ